MTRGGKREGAGAKPRSSSPGHNKSIRFSEEEWKVVLEKARGYKSISDYIRKKALE